MADTPINQSSANSVAWDGSGGARGMIDAINASRSSPSGDPILDDYFGMLDSGGSGDWFDRGYRGALSSGEVAKLKAEAAFNLASAREAREWEKKEADSAWQRKVADMQKAGFSPLAALEGSQGASVASASAAQAGSGGGGNSGANIGGLLGAIISAIAFVASKGISAAASAKAAGSLEAVRQANRVALENLRQSAIDGRSRAHYMKWTDPSNGVTHTYKNLRKENIKMK